MILLPRSRYDPAMVPTGTQVALRQQKEEGQKAAELPPPYQRADAWLTGGRSAPSHPADRTSALPLLEMVGQLGPPLRAGEGAGIPRQPNSW
jgi:hypothetical protein